MKVILYFWSPTCRPCRSMSPILDVITDVFDETINVVKIDVSGQDTRTQEFDVMVTPTILMLDDQKVLKRISGAVPMMKLRKEIEEVFNL